MNKKPFNLERALAGEPVITRDGKKVTELTHFKTLHPASEHPLTGVLDGRRETFRLDGTFGLTPRRSEYDLFMAPKIIKAWVNVYATRVPGYSVNLSSGYSSREEADAHATNTRIACIEVDIEEGQGL